MLHKPRNLSENVKRDTRESSINVCVCDMWPHMCYCVLLVSQKETERERSDLLSWREKTAERGVWTP